MQCPICGSENVHLVYNNLKRGFKGSNACCGYILLGPLGILCGSLGADKTETNEFWLCDNCGSKFKNKDIVEYNKNHPKRNKSYIDTSAVEKKPAYSEPEKPAPAALPQKPASTVLPSISTYKKDLCAPKTVLDRSEAYHGGLNAESLLKRAALFIEDKQWEKACEYSENVIDIDACCAEAYLLKFMAEYNIPSEESIPDECAFMIEQIDSLTELENYKKAHRFGNAEMKLKLEKYSDQAVYTYADKLAADADSAEKYSKIADCFERISGYSDSAERAAGFREKANLNKYLSALETMDSASRSGDFQKAETAFRELGNFRDSEQKAVECQEKYTEFQYNSACKALDEVMSDVDIKNVKAMFEKLGDYKDSKEKAKSCDDMHSELDYKAACKMLETAQTVTSVKHAQSQLEKLGSYKNAAGLAASCDAKCDDLNYNEACQLLEDPKNIRNVILAEQLLKQVGEHEGLQERLDECNKILTNFKKIALICAGVLVVIIIVIIISSAANKASENAVEKASENMANVVSETESGFETEPETTADMILSNAIYDSDTVTESTVSETDSTVPETEVVLDNYNDDDVRNAYIQKVQELAAQDSEYQFGLIDLTSKNVYELVAEMPGYHVNVYTYDDGDVVPIMDWWGYGAGGHKGYLYFPGKNIIYDSVITGTGVFYNTYMCVNYNNEVVNVYDNDLWSNYLPEYYYGGTEISKYEFSLYQVQGEFDFIGGDLSADEMIAELSGGGDIRSSVSGKILFNGRTAESLVGVPIKSIIQQWGAPLDSYYDEMEKKSYEYDGITFSTNSAGIIEYAYISPKKCLIDGISLDKNKDELIAALGSASNEEETSDAYSMYYENFATDCSVRINFKSSTDASPYEIVIESNYLSSASESENEQVVKKSKLADIVGNGLYTTQPTTDIEVNVVLADISQGDRRDLINDLKHCVDMTQIINSEGGASLYNNPESAKHTPATS